MKHLRKFENSDYREMQAAQFRARQDFEKAEDERIEKKRKELSDKYNIEKREEEIKRKSVDPERERREIVHRVTDLLVKDLNKKVGYESFKEELLSFLDEFPKE